MAMLFELVYQVVGLALKPLLLAKLSCQFGVRSLYLVVQTCLEVLRFALGLHFVILWRLTIWTVALLSLPVRAFAALYRERLLEMRLHRLKNEMEDVILDYKELEEHLHVSIKERAMMKIMIMELEHEQDEAIRTIQQLQGEVQFLKDESQRSKEIWGKSLWSYDGYVNNTDSNKKQASIDICRDKMHAGSQSHASMISKEVILARQREVALSRSLFSVILSLVVGIIVWEAEDPCIPLVVALFVVVTMSLLSTLHLFSGVEHKPASESVALLSINWFILGILALSFLQQTFKWMGL